MSELFFESTTVYRVEPALGDVIPRYESVTANQYTDPRTPFQVTGSLDPYDLIVNGHLIDPDGIIEHHCLVARKIGDRFLLLPISFLDLDPTGSAMITPELAQKILSLKDTAIGRLSLRSLAAASRRMFPRMNVLTK